MISSTRPNGSRDTRLPRALLVACAAIAFSVVAVAEPQTGTDNVIGTVVVTAQKRQQDIQDVPMSVTAISGDELRKMGAARFEDYVLSVPGMSYQALGLTGLRGVHNIVIRGISGIGGASTTYAYYIDETPIPTVDANLFDLERIEVLRGPQGTLYGASSMGGTIRVLTRKADPTQFEASVAGELSDTHDGDTNGALSGVINVPMFSNRAALRVMASYRSDSGYIDRIDDAGDPVTGPFTSNVNEETTATVRATFRALIGSATTLDLSIFGQNAQVDNFGAYDSNIPRELTQRRDVDELGQEDFRLYNATLISDFGWSTLTSSTSYYHRHSVENRELTGLVARVFGPLAHPTSLDSVTGSDDFTQELRLVSPGTHRFNWLGGLYYRNRPNADSQHYQAIDPLLPSPPVTNGNLITGDRQIDQSEFAAFGEVSYQFNDQLEAAVGLRHFNMKQSLDNVETGLFASGNNNLSGSSDDQGYTPRFYLSYKLNPEKMVYAEAAKGFRMGGINRPVPVTLCGPFLAALGLTEAPLAYEPDTLWNYELGFKGEWLDQRLSTNLSGYYIDWSNIQQTIALGCGFNFTGNIGSATSKGFELEIVGVPMAGLTVRATTAYTKARLDSAAPSLGGEPGESLLNVPEWTFSASIDYGRHLGAAYEGYVRADYGWVDEEENNFNQADPNQTRPSYGIANFRAGMRKGGFDIALFVRNAFDERPILSNLTDISLPPGTIKVVTSRPRTFGLAVEMDF